jgi:hypothetical protein
MRFQDLEDDWLGARGPGRKLDDGRRRPYFFLARNGCANQFFSWSGRIDATLNAQFFHKLKTLGLIEKGKWLRS